MTSSRPVRAAVAAFSTVALTAFAAAPALAETDPDGPACAHQAFTQPFSAFKDDNLYTLAPGGAFDSGDSGGWQLSDGAHIVEGTQPDGSLAGVLQMPSGARAVSPVVCVTRDYPKARLWVRNVAEADDVDFYVSYYRDGGWGQLKKTGKFHGEKRGWTLSKPVNVHPDKDDGWQHVRFTFIAGGKDSLFEVDDFWVDPRMRT
jgi:hypothetical protein